ncbi:M23 family metallopeptidase [Immundisolibacter sp.]|uniref:M23 family metallopeptidase n=1 Tax=Immundisolibacter sp. TaxID=1934948 RepID=UPI003566AF4A
MISLHIQWPRAGGLRSINLRGRTLVAVGGLAFGALVGSFALGASMPLSEALRDRKAIHHELRAQRSVVDETLITARAQAQALAARLGELQGRLAKLEAVGQRVGKAARLAPGTFEFDASPDVSSNGDIDKPFGMVNFVAALDGLSRQIDRRAAQFSVLDRVIGAGVIERHDDLPSPVTGGRLSSLFGSRADPFSGRPEFHPGLDFRAPLGSQVVAVAAGVVISSGWESGYGKVVEIDHGNGFRTRYAHNQTNLVHTGQTVKRSQLIARVGRTGRTTGSHLHLEVLRNGRRMDPAEYLAALAAGEGPLHTAAR